MEVPTSSGRMQSSYPRAVDLRKKASDTFVGWNKRGYLWKKLHKEANKLPGGGQGGSEAVEYAGNC